MPYRLDPNLIPATGSYGSSELVVQAVDGRVDLRVQPLINMFRAILRAHPLIITNQEYAALQSDMARMFVIVPAESLPPVLTAEDRALLDSMHARAPYQRVGAPAPVTTQSDRTYVVEEVNIPSESPEIQVLPAGGPPRAPRAAVRRPVATERSNSGGIESEDL